MKKINAALAILCLIMIINAVAYGTIIPLIYTYSSRFGIGPMGLSFLFASFSIAQFIATPLLGRLSDRIGRKPVLLGCLLGTSISLAMFAAATSAWMLFVARIIDGITGGNISVAQAFIADSTKGTERAKAFGLLGAAFGFGLLVGPALGGIMSRFGVAAPFWFAAGMALIGTLLGMFILPETLKKQAKKKSSEPLFRVDTLISSLFLPFTGIVLLLGFLTAVAQNAFVIGIQTYMVDTLKMTAEQTSFMFVAIGAQSIFLQGFGIRWLMKYVTSKKTIFTWSLLLSAITIATLGFQGTVLAFVIALLFYGFASAPILAVQIGLLSERTKGEDQGGMLGINQSYTSIGQIVGPLLAGVIMERYSLASAFLLASGIYFLSFAVSRLLYTKHHAKFDL